MFTSVFLCAGNFSCMQQIHLLTEDVYISNNLNFIYSLEYLHENTIFLFTSLLKLAIFWLNDLEMVYLFTFCPQIGS